MVAGGPQSHSERRGRSTSAREPLAAGSQQRSSPPRQQGSRSPSDNGLKTSAKGKETAVGQQSRSPSSSGYINSVTTLKRKKVDYLSQPISQILTDSCNKQLPIDNRDWFKDDYFGKGTNAIKLFDIIKWFEKAEPEDKKKYCTPRGRYVRDFFKGLAKQGPSSTAKKSDTLDWYKLMLGLPLGPRDPPTRQPAKVVLKQRALGGWYRQPYNNMKEAGAFKIQCADKLFELTGGEDGTLSQMAGTYIWSAFWSELMLFSDRVRSDVHSTRQDSESWRDIYRNMEALQRARDQPGGLEKIKQLSDLDKYKAASRSGSPARSKSPPRKPGSSSAS